MAIEACILSAVHYNRSLPICGTLVLYTEHPFLLTAEAKLKIFLHNN